MWKLLRKGEDFEERMDMEHVEDCLINKRVVHDDEWYITNEMHLPGFRLEWLTEFAGHTPSLLFGLLKKISQVNRQRRNYLLLRDWNKRRTWCVEFLCNDTFFL